MCGNDAPTSVTPSTSTRNSDSSKTRGSRAVTRSISWVSPDRFATMRCWCRADPAHEPEGVTTASYGSKASTNVRTVGTASSR